MNTIRMAAAVLLVASSVSVARAQDPICAETPEISPKWQAAMTPHLLSEHPDWPDVIQLDGSVDSRIWPGLCYWVYVPPLGASKKAPSLVMYLHGSNQSAVDAARGVRWNELADRTGAIVVYPQGPANNWNWGQSTAFGRGYGELETLSRIIREVQRTHGANPQRTYVSGASSGGITATMLGALYADHFTAVAPVIACSYNCADPTGIEAYLAMAQNAKVVPAFLIHGTLDPIFPVPLSQQADSQWAGTNDLADNGSADGSIAQVPEIDRTHMNVTPAPGGSTDFCVKDRNNPCVAGPLGLATYPYEIHRYKDQGGAGRTIVEAWYIHGLSHNYPYGDPEANYTDPAGPDVTTAAFDFFERINTAPAALADAALTPRRTPVTISVLANDTDADGDELAVADVSPAANGTVTHDGTTVTYVPRRSFTGQDAFAYSITDGHGGSATAQVTVCVPKTGTGAGC